MSTWVVLAACAAVTNVLAVLTFVQAGQIRGLRRQLRAARTGWAKERDAHGQAILAAARTRPPWQEFLNPEPDLPAQEMATLIDDLERYANGDKS